MLLMMITIMIEMVVMIIIIYLSIYQAVILLNTRHARVCGDITLPSPVVPCLSVGGNTEEGLSRTLAPSLLIAFYNLQGI